MIFLFDIDGTLTPPRQKIDRLFEHWFATWAVKTLRDEMIVLVTGSDFPKVTEQLGKLSRLITFACSGNEIWVNQERKWAHEWQVPQEVIDWLTDNIDTTQITYGNHIEQRTGCVNFSPIGRNAPQSARDDYEAFDRINHQRQEIVDRFQERFPDLQALLGGQISIDITEKGHDKAQVVELMKALSHHHITFFGNNIVEGGNDWSLVKALGRRGDATIVPVKSYVDTMLYLQRLDSVGNDL